MSPQTYGHRSLMRLNNPRRKNSYNTSLPAGSNMMAANCTVWWRGSSPASAKGTQQHPTQYPCSSSNSVSSSSSGVSSSRNQQAGTRRPLTPLVNHEGESCQVEARRIGTTLRVANDCSIAGHPSLKTATYLMPAIMPYSDRVSMCCRA
jgi:hypothetical protein